MTVKNRKNFFYLLNKLRFIYGSWLNKLDEANLIVLKDEINKICL